MDEEIPCVFLATPQNYQQTLAEYAEASGYNLAQWEMRMPPPEVLPADVSEADVYSLARCHFPGLEGEALGEFVDAVIQSCRPMQVLPLAGRFARALAERRGAAALSLSDVREAAALAGVPLPQAAPVAPTAPPSGKAPVPRSPGLNQLFA